MIGCLQARGLYNSKHPTTGQYSKQTTRNKYLINLLKSNLICNDKQQILQFHL